MSFIEKSTIQFTQTMERKLYDSFMTHADHILNHKPNLENVVYYQQKMQRMLDSFSTRLFEKQNIKKSEFIMYHSMVQFMRMVDIRIKVLEDVQEYGLEDTHEYGLDLDLLGRNI